MLVANKTDLRHDKVTIKELAKMGKQPMRVEDGQAAAARIGAYRYLECSAKFNEGVREVFETATRIVVPACTAVPTKKKRTICSTL